MVSEYVVEIFEYLKELEVQTMPNPNYMDEQKELQWKMRTILIDWLIEIHSKFRLLPETLFLAVNIVDRFLSTRVVALLKLQLVGVTAMFIAAKYEEVVPPNIADFVYMSDGGYTDDEVLQAERYLLQALDFSLQYPNPLNFLRRCSKADGYDIQTRTIAKYLMEITLMDQCFLELPPSKIAAASMYLSRVMLGRTDWVRAS
ncbi:cyclin-like protein [Blyttiomyces helicus]|uniref:Cyclin-like protein n=1 Tax=Blyttiomyces helicus TaxID=388810 RepID=A0A4P9W792_9FUNG|nr:cyclin-like protein [Blyttiomyces helicus]|eukprot:RKO87263.1 cyclin-like protein [Blyttiomyces helicus]